MKGKIRLHGIATHHATKGDRVEVEIDLGTTSDFITALENEPPDVTLIRIERERELMEEVNALTMRAQHLEKQNRLLERELAMITGESSLFIAELASEIATRLVEHAGSMLRGRED